MVKGGNEQVYRNWDAAKGGGGYNEEKRKTNSWERQEKSDERRICFCIGSQWRIQLTIFDTFCPVNRGGMVHGLRHPRVHRQQLGWPKQRWWLKQ